MKFFNELLVPGVPSNVIFSDIQSDSFVLSWSAPNPSQCQYTDSYVVNCSSHTDQPYHTAVESSLTVTGLLPFTSYNCCVTANNSAGEGNQTCSTVRTEPGTMNQTIAGIRITITLLCTAHILSPPRPATNHCCHQYYINFSTARMDTAT